MKCTHNVTRGGSGLSIVDTSQMIKPFSTLWPHLFLLTILYIFWNVINIIIHICITYYLYLHLCSIYWSYTPDMSLQNLLFICLGLFS